MSHVPVIGLTGNMRAGKDKTLERMITLFGAANYRRASFADPLKRSAAALLNLTVEQLEAMKNEPMIRIQILDLKGNGRDLGRSLSMREFLQRYGTEAHRNEFGEDFWVDHAMRTVGVQDAYGSKPDRAEPTVVFTDVRFDNEAKAIIERGGRVYRVVGPPEDVDVHVSEQGIDPELIFGEISNELRPSFDILAEGGADAQREIDRCIAILDDEVARVHGEIRA